MDPMETTSSCPFCVLASGVDSFRVESKQSDIFYRDDNIIAFISAGWWPNNPGSVLSQESNGSSAIESYLRYNPPHRTTGETNEESTRRPSRIDSIDDGQRVSAAAVPT